MWPQGESAGDKGTWGPVPRSPETGGHVLTGAETGWRHLEVLLALGWVGPYTWASSGGLFSQGCADGAPSLQGGRVSDAVWLPWDMNLPALAELVRGDYKCGASGHSSWGPVCLRCLGSGSGHLSLSDLGSLHSPQLLFSPRPGARVQGRRFPLQRCHCWGHCFRGHCHPTSHSLLGWSSCCSVLVQPRVSHRGQCLSGHLSLYTSLHSSGFSPSAGPHMPLLGSIPQYHDALLVPGLASSPSGPGDGTMGAALAHHSDSCPTAWFVSPLQVEVTLQVWQVRLCQALPQLRPARTHGLGRSRAVQEASMPGWPGGSPGR